MKQKKLRMKEGRKLVTILSSVCILFILIILGLRKIHRQELPHDLKTEYDFNSGVTTHEKTYESTPTIYFPESMRQKGDYEINNKTGYQICVATPEAARDYKGKKVGVLNFADAVTPGGAVLYGASTQEEAICRCSTLYENISKDAMLEVFYQPHKLLNVLYNDDIIYTPDVVVFKEDTSEANMLPKEEWYPVDVITCAAPYLGAIPKEERKMISTFELMLIFSTRIERILEVAKKKGAEVLILGAFGCGAFANPPEIVAKVFKEALEIYGKYFESVEFAVYCAEEETRNYKVFKEVLEDF